MSETNQEQTIFRGSSSPWIKLRTFVLCGIVLGAAVVFGFILSGPTRYVLFGLAAVTVIYLIAEWLMVKMRVYEVTSERIRVTQGVFTRRTDELELYRVKDTTLIEPLSLRLLSLGHIEVVSHDVSIPVLRLEAIKGAKALREELRKSIETCRDRKRVRLAELE
jgi:uncharacterized membrane protein YdbT with pleckstrin-like domain